MNLSIKQHFLRAEESGYALGQFNVSTADQVKAVMVAAVKMRAPVILGTSEGEREFFGLRQVVKLCEAYEEEETGLPIMLNADHTKSVEKIEQALKAGYNSVHFDGSELDYEENIRQTKAVVEMTRKFGEEISAEGELGYIAGASKLIKEKVEIKPEYYTNPEQAKDFVERTGIDRLAVVIGNSHGISLDEPALDIERLKKIYDLVKGKTVLVLHGGSGIPDEQIQAAIQNGIRKININTELRLAFSDALRKKLAETDETTLYKFLQPAMDAMGKVVEEKIKLFKISN